MSTLTSSATGWEAAYCCGGAFRSGGCQHGCRHRTTWYSAKFTARRERSSNDRHAPALIIQVATWILKSRYLRWIPAINMVSQCLKLVSYHKGANCSTPDGAGRGLNKLGSSEAIGGEDLFLPHDPGHDFQAVAIGQLVKDGDGFAFRSRSSETRDVEIDSLSSGSHASGRLLDVSCSHHRPTCHTRRLTIS